MSERDMPGASLLAAQLRVNCMKWSLRRPVRFSTVFYGDIEHSFSIREGIAVIERALLRDRRFPYLLEGDISEFEEGDSISGKALWGCSNAVPRKVAVGAAGERSGQHSRQLCNVKGDPCYVVTVTSWKGENIDPHPSQQTHCVGHGMKNESGA